MASRGSIPHHHPSEQKHPGTTVQTKNQSKPQPTQARHLPQLPRQPPRCNGARLHLSTRTPAQVTALPLLPAASSDIKRARSPAAAAAAASASGKQRRARHDGVDQLDERLPHVLRRLGARLAEPGPVRRRQRLTFCRRDGARRVRLVELRADLDPVAERRSVSLFCEEQVTEGKEARGLENGEGKKKRERERKEVGGARGRARRPGRCCSPPPRTTCPWSGSWLCGRCRTRAGRPGRRGRSLSTACESVLGRPGEGLCFSDRLF